MTNFLRFGILNFLIDQRFCSSTFYGQLYRSTQRPTIGNGSAIVLCCCTSPSTTNWVPRGLILQDFAMASIGQPASSLKRNSQIEGDVLIITPLGAGSEIGRSCIYMAFKGKTVM